MLNKTFIDILIYISTRDFVRFSTYLYTKSMFQKLISVVEAPLSPVWNLQLLLLFMYRSANLRMQRSKKKDISKSPFVTWKISLFNKNNLARWGCLGLFPVKTIAGRPFGNRNGHDDKPQCNDRMERPRRRHICSEVLEEDEPEQGEAQPFHCLRKTSQERKQQH